jgi:tetratricopeptide (TPR) repeat protein
MHLRKLFLAACIFMPAYFLVILPAVNGVSEQQEKTAKAVAPDHQIKYEDSLSPDWKITWDLARQLYREEKYREALVQYELLFARKENIDEARWEYASILIHMQRWSQAREQMEKLLVNEPENTAYLLSLAGIFLESGSWEKAVHLYSRLYEPASDSAVSTTALEGLIEGLAGLGSNELLQPLLKELNRRKPGHFESGKKLLELKIDLGQLDEAESLLLRLENDRPEDVSLLTMKARLSSALGDNQGAAASWLRLIAADGENLTAHRQMVEHYREQENWSGCLEHLEVILKHDPRDIDLLEQAAELNMKLDRLDTALKYYEFGLVAHPADINLLRRKREAQKMLARDLLILVENNGSEKLWDDLNGVTSDRPGVYREIAVLLREKGQTVELIEVLFLLYQENPQDEYIYRELTALLEQAGRSDELVHLRQSRNRID